MKRILLLIVAFFIFHFSFFNSRALAATPTPTDDATLRDQLINKIASRVAQLKLVEKRGIIGKVTEISNTQITLSDSDGNVRFVDVDELTKFSNPAIKGSFGISDISKGDMVGVLGLYNKESRRILARFVNIVSVPAIIHGGVSTLDRINYVINMTTEEGKQFKVDVETLTRTYSYTQTGGMIKSGFSKIKENLNIIATGVLDKKNPNTLIATRIFFFPDIPSGPKVNSSLEHAVKTK